MAVAPTYPGVYIEEVPSGVHTITGVATSIAAFVGYTTQGPVNQAIHIFSFADFERACGGLSTDSVLSYTVKQFFQNGGTEAYVVRVAAGATPASVKLRDGTNDVLTVTAAGEGTWGNGLQVDVDYDTSNPASLFNLKVAEMVDQNGSLVPKRVEVFRNLSLYSLDGAYAVTVVNATSELIRLTRGTIATTKATSTSGSISAGDLTALAAASPAKLAFTVNGLGPFEVTCPTPASMNQLATDLQTAVDAKVGANVLAITNTATELKLETIDATEKASVQVVAASSPDAAPFLHLGVARGGVEIIGTAGARPLRSGTTGTSTMAFPPAATGALKIDVKRGANATVLESDTLAIWGGTSPALPPTSLDGVAQLITNAMTAAVTATPPAPLLAGAVARRVGGTIQIIPSAQDPNLSFDISTGIAPTLGLNAAAARNVAHYALGAGIAALGQGAVVAGNNGTPPTVTELTGKLVDKTGIYALEDVDLFNLFLMPDADTGDTTKLSALTEALAYCVRRRAMMLIDAPETKFDLAQQWIGSQASPLRSRNSALYYPRLREPDPLMKGIARSFPAVGALAGLYARTDAERGVWKAPAGTTATISGAVGLSYTLTDAENGTLNPLGLNCLRTFPVFGTVAWGARTGNGADAMADEYKYIPVRRLALFLEESLYRGTQWVVFEPNDEPLWAQIRLNLGAFMHTLFAQGAFQGKTSREAYFVKCDKETTTQNDIDLGRVNIVVGFAPLKPAEFVIIRIQQIVRDLQT